MKLCPYADHWVGLHDINHRLTCLNETGRYIWLAHGEGVPVAEITRQLCKKSGKSENSMEVEVRQLLASISVLDQEADASPPFRGDAGRSRSQLIRVPESEPSFQTMYYRLGGALMAIQSPHKLFRELITPLIGHMAIAVQAQVHLLIQLDNDGKDYLLQLTNETLKLSTYDKLVERLLFEMLEAAYRVSRTLAVLHAAAVMKDDQALLFIGAQGSGKSTLVASLCAENMTYLSDDLCPLDEKGRLVPVPAPQAIKKGSWQVLSRDYPDILELPVYQRLGHAVRYLPPINKNAGSWQQAWHVGALIFPGYDANTEPLIEALDPLEKLQLLTLSNSLRGDSDLAELLQWLEEKPAYRLSYSDTNQVAGLLEQIQLN